MRTGRYGFWPGDLLILALVLAPTALVWSRLSRSFGDDVGTSLLAIGRGAGIFGLALALVAGAASVRLPHFDGLFGGLTRLWKLHHTLAFFGFLLVLFHTWLIGFSALPISRDLPAKILFPSLSSTATWLGWLAVLAMLAFLAPSFKFFGHPDYQKWKWLHMAAAPAALLLAFLHVRSMAPESGVWWLLGGLAAGSVGWRRVGSRLVARRSYTVSAVEPLARDVVEISLRADGRRLAYKPGQFVYLTPAGHELSAGRGEEHPFSLSSAPQEEMLRLGIKDLGNASHALQSLTPGARVQVEGPFGSFFERTFPDRGQVWLGGGIGITPIVGAVRSLSHAGVAPAGGVHVFYLADSRERAYYRDALLAATDGTRGLTVTEHYFSREGAMTPEFLARHCPDFATREAYICGPPAMLAHLRRVLRRSGVPGARIRSEEFTFL